MSDTQPPTPDVFSWATDWLFPPANRVRRKWSEDELRALIRVEIVNMVVDMADVVQDDPGPLSDLARAFNNGYQSAVGEE